MSDAVSSGSGACTTVGTVGINGDIDRGSPFVLDATATASASVVCAAGSGSTGVLLSVSLGYTAVMTGSR
jgi:hypothetical protein